jgi:hypothetical protein
MAVIQGIPTGGSPTEIHDMAEGIVALSRVNAD